LERNISELDEEITSLSTIKSILARFAEELRVKTDMVLQLDSFNDTAALSIAGSVSFSKNYVNNVKGNVVMETMENLSKANETLSKLKDSDVRIIYLPPMTVVSAHCSVGEGKNDFIRMIEKFVREAGLLKIKPDARGMMAGDFSKEDLEDEDSAIISAKEAEFWVSIPDEMEVPAPLTKKTFDGGLYAAHLFRNAFEDLRFLAEWVNASERYELADGCPSFLELLNYHNWMPNYKEDAKRDDAQSDLLLPIKKITE